MFTHQHTHIHTGTHTHAYSLQTIKSKELPNEKKTKKKKFNELTTTDFSVLESIN